MTKHIEFTKRHKIEHKYDIIDKNKKQQNNSNEW